MTPGQAEEIQRTLDEEISRLKAERDGARAEAAGYKRERDLLRAEKAELQERLSQAYEGGISE